MGVDRVPSPYSKGFSDTVVVSGSGRWIFVSGHVGADERGELVSDSFRAEADQCFKRIRQSLEAVGASMADVIQITGFITNFDGLYADYAASREAAFPIKVPASLAVEVTKLALGARVEVQTIAFVAD